MLLLSAALWTPVALLGLVAAARFVAHDRFLLSIWADAFTAWLYVPVYPVALVAVLSRRWALFAVAAALAACHIAWVIPDYTAGHPLPAETAPDIRLFTANLRDRNPDASAIFREAIAADADVVFVQEFTFSAERAARAAGIEERYPFRAGQATASSLGTAIYSRLPLEQAETWDVAGVPMTRATVAVGGRRIRLYNVHPGSPTSFADARRWAREHEAILAAAGAEQGDLVVAGDFNMTSQHRWFGAYLGLGLREAHRECGRGNATTWPNGRSWLPGIRIDHVFASNGLGCVSVREGRGEGSDHAPVIVALAFRR